MSEQPYDHKEAAAAVRRWAHMGAIRWDVLQATIGALSQDPDFRRMFLALLPEEEREDLRETILEAVRSRNALLERLGNVLNDVSLWPRIEEWAREHDPDLCTAWKRFKLEYQRERSVPNERTQED
jgi:hypothetical protein